MWGDASGSHFENSGALWLPGTSVFLSVSSQVCAVSPHGLDRCQSVCVSKACPQMAALRAHRPPTGAQEHQW